MSTIPDIKLNDGFTLPALGFGVYRSSSQDTPHAVETALERGYRLIDTAAAYQNERETGAGIRQSGISRSDIFVTTKLWLADYGYDAALRAFDRSINNLGLDYLDLYLLHWPSPSSFDLTIAAYQAAEKLRAEGRIRSIGVCNFNAGHLEALIEKTGVIPALNQIEFHPYFNQSAVSEANNRYGIVTQAWSPIGGVKRYFAQEGTEVQDPLHDPAIGAIAEKYGKSAAQVILRWHLQSGRAAIPKSVQPARIAENIAVFDFSLTADEISAIDSLDRRSRGGPDPETFDLDAVQKLSQDNERMRQLSRLSDE